MLAFRAITPAPQSWLDGLAARIVLARDEAGWSQVQLAREVGCCRNMIIKMEKGQNQPSAHMLLRLCRALGVSADYPLGMKGETE